MPASGRAPDSISGSLSLKDGKCLVLTAANGTTYLLAEHTGDPYWPTAAVLDGSTASATGLLLPGSPDCADRSLYVLTLSIVNSVGGSTTDTDGDGVDDSYEEAFYSTLAFGANDDPDGDGVTIGQSFAAGAPPSGGTIISPPTDGPVQVAVTRGASWNEFVLSWVASPGKTFTVNASGDMTNWRSAGGTVEEPQPGTYRWTTTVVPQFARLQFFQVVEK